MIQLKEDTHLYALTTLHCVGIPLMKSVKKELSCMEEFGVIVYVDKPIDCCCGMLWCLRKTTRFVSV